ncbi:MAG: hypothetical protein WDO19_31075 [Bacteroidota bacterium]
MIIMEGLSINGIKIVSGGIGIRGMEREVVISGIVMVPPVFGMLDMKNVPGGILHSTVLTRECY